MGQRFAHIVQTAYDGKLFVGTNHHIGVATELCKRAANDFANTKAPMGQYGALVGFSIGGKPHLCEFALADFQPEFKPETMWYCSMGGGQPITDPFLGLMREIFWKAGPPAVQDATFAVTWTLDHAVQVNPGGINNPVRIAVLEKHDGKFRARLLADEDLEEHRQNIEQAKDGLRKFSASQRADAPGTPEVPKPSTSAQSAK
jgi:hypothetical protein